MKISLDRCEMRCRTGQVNGPSASNLDFRKVICKYAVQSAAGYELFIMDCSETSFDRQDRQMVTGETFADILFRYPSRCIAIPGDVVGQYR